MGKSKFEAADYVGKKIKNTEDIGNGYTRITFDDNTSVVVQFVPVAMTIIADGKGATKADKKAKEAEVEDEEDEDEGEEATQEEMREALVESGLSKKKVKGMSDDEVEEAYEALPEEDDEDDEDEDEDEEVSEDDMRDALVESGMTKKAAKALKGDKLKAAYDELEDDESEDEDEDEAEGDELTSNDLKEMDFDDLEDTIDEYELEIDIEDYDSDDKKSVEKLRKAVAKALNIKY